MKALQRWSAAVLTWSGITLMRVLALMPLRVVRGLGAMLGWALYVLVGSRRRVVTVNLTLCFKELPAPEIKRLTQQTFVYFAQAWLDRSWVWHAPRSWLLRRVTMTGAVDELIGNEPTVVFTPHFVGMDAAWAGMVLRQPRQSVTIYTDQSNQQIDRWIFKGRSRWGFMRLLGRANGVKPAIAAVRAGEPLYLLPDMDFGPVDSIFVPFYGIATATVPSLPRFARLGRAKVVPAVVTMTRSGYELRIHPAWPDFPTDDLAADTALMNQHLESYINANPAQYYWVHKRFKTRPPGEPQIY
jgi:Kdo2-lipid IVA lauroyltransferase/acyltransferase